MRNIDIHSGFNEFILEAFRFKTSSMSSQDKVVAVAFDEMSIRKAPTYDQGRDAIEGIAEAPTKTHDIADHALVFMVRGLCSKWKQPVGYFLSSGPMRGLEMKMLLLMCIDKLHDIGLTVLVCVSDQGSNNQTFF